MSTQAPGQEHSGVFKLGPTATVAGAEGAMGATGAVGGVRRPWRTGQEGPWQGVWMTLSDMGTSGGFVAKRDTT